MRDNGGGRQCGVEEWYHLQGDSEENGPPHKLMTNTLLNTTLQKLTCYRDFSLIRRHGGSLVVHADGIYWDLTHYGSLEEGLFDALVAITANGLRKENHPIGCGAPTEHHETS